MATDRIRKVNMQLRRDISEIIVREIELPLDVLVTVLSVDSSRDLQHAVVYVSVLPDGKRASTLELLRKRTGLVQHLLGDRLRFKFTPKISFRLDEQQIKAQRLYDTMDSLHNKNDETY